MQTWSSPLVVAVMAAAIAGMGNAAVALINGVQQRQIESEKQEADLIREAVMGRSPEAAAAKLEFLLETGLVRSPERTQQINAYLGDRERLNKALVDACAKYPALCG